MQKILFQSVIQAFAISMALCNCTHPQSEQKETTMPTYYTFEIEDQHIGYYSEVREKDLFKSVAFMKMGGKWYDNSFWLRLEGERITGYTFTGEDWFDFEQDPDVFPTSALPLLIPKVLNEETGEFTYRQFIEGEHAVGKTAVLKLEGRDVIVEYVDGQPHRKIFLNGNSVQEYQWGGTAKSIRCATEADAKKGLNLP